GWSTTTPTPTTKSPTPSSTASPRATSPGTTSWTTSRRTAAAADPGRLHDVPRRDLADSAQLGRGELSEPHLLQRGRQGRPLRRLGGAGALLRGTTRRV